MKDYFGEFLLNPEATFGVEDSIPGSNEPVTRTSIKTHIIWALAVVSVGVISWKGSSFYAKYKSLNEKNESE
jgi:hypothetical protein